MNEVIPLAEKMLSEFGEFYPYGAYIKPDHEIVHVGAKEVGTDHPKSRSLIAILKESFRALAREKKCVATAIVCDVVVPIPIRGNKGDAIQICLDHVKGYSAEVFFPYDLVNGRVEYGPTFAQKGKHDFFGAMQDKR